MLRRNECAIVVPCFNEARRIQRESFIEFVEHHDWVSLIFVNDGSRDDTLEILMQLAEHPSKRIHVVNLKENQGKGEAVRQGMQKAMADGFEFFGYLDADLATPLDAVPRLVGVFHQFPEFWMVIGSRVQLLGRVIKRKMIRHYLGRIFATVVSIILKLPVYDTQCGAKFFRNQAATELVFQRKFISRWIFDVEIIKHMISIKVSNRISEPGKRIYEMPLDRWEEIAGTKLRSRDFVRAFTELFKIYRLDFSQDTIETDI
ncbi:MAG: glycosyltransferase [Isosphaeraceae bacterium]